MFCVSFTLWRHPKCSCILFFSLHTSFLLFQGGKETRGEGKGDDWRVTGYRHSNFCNEVKYSFFYVVGFFGGWFGVFFGVCVCVCELLSNLSKILAKALQTICCEVLMSVTHE